MIPSSLKPLSSVLIFSVLILVSVLSTPSLAAETAATVTANDIPVAYTPEGYWKTMPEPILATCTEPLADGVTDMRGMWQAYDVKAGGQPTEIGLDHVERVEQCGNRVIVVSGGVTHDMRCDGTHENGVNDVSARGSMPITVACTFEDGVHTLRPKGMPGVTVTRQIIDGELIWGYPPNRVTKMRRVAPEK